MYSISPHCCIKAYIFVKIVGLNLGKFDKHTKDISSQRPPTHGFASAHPAFKFAVLFSTSGPLAL